MHVKVNGVRLYVDIEGAGLVPDGPRMRQKPTLLLLHGGPGGDHSIYKPAFSALSDICQIVYYDHRGCGRSEDGSHERWTLAQWGDDVKGVCDALGIDKPIVLGTSFGGFVAQAYATRHSAHPAKLILISTAAKVDFQQIYEAFERFGGAEAAVAARAYWSTPSDATRAVYRDICVPLYSARPSAQDRSWMTRAITRNETGIRFNGPHNEHGRFDFRTELTRI
jgi:proline iminopeptidase